MTVFAFPQISRINADERLSIQHLPAPRTERQSVYSLEHLCENLRNLREITTALYHISDLYDIADT